MGEKIHADTLVLVVDIDGNSIGKMLYDRAEKLAEEQSLDLVEVSHNKGSIVYKIMDRGKWTYDRRKSRKQKPQHKQVTKSVKFSLLIDPHDRDTKIKQLIKFIEKGYDVNVVVSLKGREKSHPEQGKEKLQEILDSLEGLVHYSNLSQGTEKNRVVFSTVVHPLKGKKHAKAKNDKDHESRETEVCKDTKVVW